VGKIYFEFVTDEHVSGARGYEIETFGMSPEFVHSTSTRIWNLGAGEQADGHTLPSRQSCSHISKRADGNNYNSFI